jgi:hypothetical protein
MKQSSDLRREISSEADVREWFLRSQVRVIDRNPSNRC